MYDGMFKGVFLAIFLFGIVVALAAIGLVAAAIWLLHHLAWV